MYHKYIKIFCEYCLAEHDVPVYCGNRFCPICNNGRRRNAHNRISFLVENAARPRSFRMKMLTLTIPSQSDVASMISDLLLSFRRLRQRKEWLNKVDGGVFVIEITGRPGNWHAHLHIVMMSRWISIETLFKLWRQCSPGRGVWIDDIPSSRAVKYCVKYVSKPSVPNDVLEYINSGLKGTRLFHPFGSWHALGLIYKKPSAVCKTCGQQSLVPLADYTDDWDPHWKDFAEPFPEEIPIIYHCPKTAELSLV